MLDSAAFNWLNWVLKSLYATVYCWSLNFELFYRVSCHFKAALSVQKEAMKPDQLNSALHLFFPFFRAWEKQGLTSFSFKSRFPISWSIFLKPFTFSCPLSSASNRNYGLRTFCISTAIVLVWERVLGVQWGRWSYTRGGVQEYGAFHIYRFFNISSIMDSF